jgi:4a-hydroxytetrahydrobiopterin dehydratase
MIDNSDLSSEQCQACRADAPRVDAQTQNALLQQIPAWDVVRSDGVDRLQRSFDFPDFSGALAFTDLVGALAESLGHHPEIVTAWGNVTVNWWTHKIRGLHRNDFIAAAKTDQLYR